MIFQDSDPFRYTLPTASMDGAGMAAQIAPELSLLINDEQIPWGTIIVKPRQQVSRPIALKNINSGALRALSALLHDALNDGIRHFAAPLVESAEIDRHSALAGQKRL